MIPCPYQLACSMQNLICCARLGADLQENEGGGDCCAESTSAKDCSVGSDLNEQLVGPDDGVHSHSAQWSHIIADGGGSAP